MRPALRHSTRSAGLIRFVHGKTAGCSHNDNRALLRIHLGNLRAGQHIIVSGTRLIMAYANAGSEFIPVFSAGGHQRTGGLRRGCRLW